MIFNERRRREKYTTLEYIQSTGKQYIDTGFKPNNNTRVVTKMSFEPISNGTSSYVFGAANSGSSGMFEVSTGSNVIRFTFAGTATTKSFPSSRPFDIDFNKNTVTVDGTTYTLTDGDFSGSNTMYIFDTNRGKAYRAVPRVKVYSFKIYDNGVLVRDFVPCENTEGEVGLWDKVTGKFYGNSGTGQFLRPGEVYADLTWLINEKFTLPPGYPGYKANFTSNGTAYVRLQAIGNSLAYFYLINSGTSESMQVTYNGTSWVNEAYRTITFGTEPTGKLLTWLQANATPQ